MNPKEINEYRKNIDRLFSKVILINTNETGKWLWAVTDVKDKEAWIASFATRGEALVYCRMHCLEIVESEAENG